MINMTMRYTLIIVVLLYLPWRSTAWADTSDPVAPGNVEIDWTFGAEDLSSSQRVLGTSFSANFGIHPRISIACGHSLNTYAHFESSSKDWDLEAYALIIDTPHWDLDLIFHLHESNGAMDLMPAFELNWDAQDHAWGLYSRLLFPIAGSDSDYTWAIDQTLAAYVYLLPNHKVVLESDGSWKNPSWLGLNFEYHWQISPTIDWYHQIYLTNTSQLHVLTGITGSLMP